MSYLLTEELVLLNEELIIFNEDFVEYVLNLSDEELSLMETSDIEIMYDYLLEAVGEKFDHRWGNMFVNHRQRTELVPLAKNMQTHHIYRAADKLSDQKLKGESLKYQSYKFNTKYGPHKPGNTVRDSALRAYQRAKTKLGKNHPYTKQKHEEFKKVRDINANIGVNKSTHKALTKKYGLMDLNQDGIEKSNKIIKKDKDGNKKEFKGRKTVDISAHASSGNPNTFENRHNQYNRNAWKAKERLERYLNGERKHLQRDKDGNIIKDKNGKAKVFYDKYDRDEKTGKKIGKAKEWSDDEYAKAHDENVSRKINPVRDKLMKKSMKERGLLTTMPKSINGALVNINPLGNNGLGSADEKQYNSKTGKIDKPLADTTKKYEDMVKKYDKDKVVEKFKL